MMRQSVSFLAFASHCVLLGEMNPLLTAGISVLLGDTLD